MANTKQTKKYLGGWDTSAYEDLSRASKQSYETNWDIIKERFNNLLAEQDARQQEAIRNYNNTLANQTNAMFNAQRAVDQNLANRGVADSGVRSLIGQEQTRGVGGNVNTALSKLMDTTSDTVNAQLGGIGDLLNSGNKLNQKQLADQLDIVADKQAADMEGQQLAAQLAEQEAARAARGGAGSGSKEKEEYNEKLRQLAVWNILNDIDPETGKTLDISDGEKAFLLHTLYDVADASDVVKGFKPLIKSDTSYLEDDKTLKEYQNFAKKQKALNLAEENLSSVLKNRSTYVKNYGEQLTQNKIKTRDEQLAKAKKEYEEALSDYQKTDFYKNREYISNLASMPLEEYYNMIYNKR